ncbi:HAMP domain-containing sensor histidine kinase (plasmid) [Rhizobium sp. 32-5/1]|uniref:sensor histidine kinase n=1 Tax=Rhizobium sp. 32-5/1 TaxID=3019602 RepID=UPI00240DABDD|nr:HAMP domain-containing sensor histidine kinase [Rhizobium sp. 32-5/1]WEZ85777.1 HAMP domain-containing sensor histidine kinase [Rhizobium sp. 32-5/1]
MGEGMLEKFLQYFETNSFLAHGYCMTWRTDLIALHAISDLVIFSSYFIIPTAILYITIRRPDLVPSRIALLFCVFIFACGMTHLVGFITLWEPVYSFEGVLKAATAVVSGATAVASWTLMPSALKLPSTVMLEQKNDALARSGQEQQRAYAELEQIKSELELRIQQRTQELRDKADALEQMNTSLSQYAHFASHDLQEPLRKIVSFSELAIEEDTARGPDLKMFLETINESAKRARNLVRNILQHAELDQHTAVIHQLSLKEETKHALETHELSIRDRKGEVKVDIHDIRVRADPTLVSQILENLISNAIKYTPVDRTLRVSIITQLSDEGMEYVITDNGIGFDPVFKEKIFEPFTRLNPGNGVIGTGMGLAIVAKALKQLGWSIVVETAHMQGTSFRITIPADQIVQDEQE